MAKSTNPSRSPSILSTIDVYRPPGVVAVLARGPGTHGQPVDLDSRESTPSLVGIPPEVQHWKTIIKGVRSELEKDMGVSEAAGIRLSITDLHYWKTEAQHYAEYWDLATGKLSDQFDDLRSITTEDIRRLVPDIHYWELEAMHYKRYSRGTRRTNQATRKRKSTRTSAPRPAAIRKRKHVSQPPASLIPEDAPVSSRLRSRPKKQSPSRRGTAKGAKSSKRAT